MIPRGFVLTSPDSLKPVFAFYAKMFLLKSIKKPVDKVARIRLYLGTAEIFGSIVAVGEPVLPGHEGYVKVMTKEPAVSVRGDRFILREVNSSMTLGGGEVLDHVTDMNEADEAYLQSMDCVDVSTAVSQFISFHKMTTNHQLVSLFGLSASMIETEIKLLEKQKQVILLSNQKKTVIDSAYFTCIQNELLQHLKVFHEKNPAEKGIKISELKAALTEVSDQDVFDFLIIQMKNRGFLNDEKKSVSLSSHRIQISDRDSDHIKAIEHRLFRDLFSPPSMDAITLELRLTSSETSRLLKIMIQTGKAIKSSENIYFHAEAVQEARQFVIDFIGKNGHIKITDFKDRFQTSRKFALSLLEYFDAIQVTSRNGDSRVLL